MRFTRRAVLTAVVGLAAASGAFAQTTGGGGTGGTGGTAGGTGGSSGSGLDMPAAPTITGAQITGTSTTSGTGASRNSGVDTSNFLSATYSNPYYQGLYSNTAGTIGGFGTPLYGTTGGTGGMPGSTGTGGRTTGTGTSTGARGGATTTGFGGTSGRTSTGFGTSVGGTGGRGGLGGGMGGGFGGGTGMGGTGSGIGGVIVPLPRNISYTAVLRFSAPVVTQAQVRTDVQAVLHRSNMLSAPAGVQVVTDGAVIVLRGSVKDEDEARLAEGIVRLNPGVRDVRNELTFPKQ